MSTTPLQIAPTVEEQQGVSLSTLLIHASGVIKAYAFTVRG
jgi:hypothetical protein